MRTLSSLRPPTCLAALLALAGLLVVVAEPGFAGSVTEDFTTATYRDAGNTSANWDTTAGELGLYPFALASVATVPSVNVVEEIAVQGNLLYAACRTGGFRVVDITNPESPLLIGFASIFAKDVEVSGDFAYVASGTSLRILDVGDPYNPTIIGAVSTPAQAYGVAIHGTVAYVAARTAGLLAYDVSDPATPILLGSRVTPQAFQVQVAGSVAYVADETGVRVLDVSDPANPDSIGAYPIAVGCNDVLIDGNRLHVAALGSGLITLDISDPANPVLLGTLSISNATKLGISGTRLYVGRYSASLTEVDISDPTNPQVVQSLNLSDFIYAVVPEGEFLYVAGLNGLQVLRRNHAYPLSGNISGFIADAPVNQVDVSGDLAFISTDSHLKIHRILPPGTVDPVALGTLPQIARGTHLDGSLAYVAALGNGLRVVDVSDPTTPVQIGMYATPGFAVDVDVVGNLAYVADFDSGLVILDVTDPTSPSFLGSVDSPGTPTRVVVEGSVAWCANGAGGVQVIDVSDPTNPTQIATIPGNTTCVAVEGDRLYVGRDGGIVLQVYNVFNPATPASMGSVAAAGSASGIAIDGDLLFLANSNPAVGIQMIDISLGGTPIQITNRAFGVDLTDVALYGQWAITVGGLFHEVSSVRVFQDDLNSGDNVGQSTELDAYDETISTVRLQTTQGFQVEWEVSADGGANWEAIAPDNAWHDLAVPGNDLRWRSTHNFLDAAPSVSDLTIEWLYPFGDVTRIVDVPGDQGGRVYVEFQRSRLDDVAEASTPIIQYSVYREVTDPLPATAGPIIAPAAAGSGDAILPEGTEADWVDGRLYVKGGANPLDTGFPTGTWVLVASIPAVQIERYLVEVTTDADSSDTGTNDDTFFVLAHTSTPSVYYRSPMAVGHSVDNLAPGVPQNLAAVFDQGSILLSWDPAPEQDFQYHRIYRSGDPAFLPGPGNLVHETASSSWQDTPPDPAASYYKVTTLDHAGNESEPATLQTVTAVGDEQGAARFKILGAMPNPVRSGTSIAFHLPEDAPVILEVFDVRGRRIRTLADAQMPAGRHEIAWDGTDRSGSRVAAGVYLYRLRAGAFEGTQRLVVVR